MSLDLVSHKELWNNDRIQGAIGFAVVRHGDQQYAGKPYLVHLQLVAEAVYKYYVCPNWGQFKEYSEIHDVLIAALLHDVLEDTDTTGHELHDRFGKLATAIVSACTKNDDEDLCRSCSFKRTVPALKAVPHAIAVKLADRLVNMRHSLQERSSHLNMYVREYPEFKRLLRDPIDAQTPVQRIVNDVEGPGPHRVLWAELEEVYEKGQIKAK